MTYVGVLECQLLFSTCARWGLLLWITSWRQDKSVDVGGS